MVPINPPIKKSEVPIINRKTLAFGLTAVFLCGVGFGVIAPAVPFLVHPYVDNPADQAIAVTLLVSVYAFCVFIAAPGLGALSDRFGRRPLLLLCLVGSAMGFLIFGLGGALWVLFLGRALEGVAGGSISTIFAFFADITPKEHRTKYFGWISASMGAGFFIGPTLGGLLTAFGYSAPFFAGALITILNAAFGFFVMPETLPKQRRLSALPLLRLNPFLQLKSIFSMKNLAALLLSAFLVWVAAGSFQAVFSQFTIDAFSWEPVYIGLAFSIIGAQDVVSQGLIMPQLLNRLSDSQIARLGMSSEIVGYCCIAVSALFSLSPLFIAGMFIFGFGDSIFSPSFNGMVSKSVGPDEQGRVLGGSQSIQALARILGPVFGGQLYVTLGHASPFIMGMVLVTTAIVILRRSVRKSSPA